MLQIIGHLYNMANVEHTQFVTSCLHKLFLNQLYLLSKLYITKCINIFQLKFHGKSNISLLFQLFVLDNYKTMVHSSMFNFKYLNRT